MALSLARWDCWIGPLQRGTATQEIGVRMALGASTRDVMKMVLWEGLKLALFGVGGGLVAAFRVDPRDGRAALRSERHRPGYLCGDGRLLTLVALFAAWLPARKATTVDPLVALRYE